MRIISLNIGQPSILLRGSRRVSSSINRRPVDSPVRVTPDGFDGDRVSDTRAHGGPDKAVCVYPLEHYAHFAALLGRPLAPPSFGENLTTEGLLETEVCIGDRFQVGSAVFEVSQPRAPCAKLAMKHNRPEMIEWVNESGFGGFYFRAIEDGEVRSGDAIRPLAAPDRGISIAALSRARLSGDAAVLRAAAALPSLAGAWRTMIERRLAGMEEFDE